MRLARQVEVLQKDSAHDVAYCDAEIINERGIKTGKRFSDQFPVPGNGSGRLFHRLCAHNFVNMQTAILRRECIADVGYLDQGIKWAGDGWVWGRVEHRDS